MDDIKLIYRYYKNKLTFEEVVQFEKRLYEDKEFRKEYEEYKSINWGMHITHVDKCSIFGAYANPKESNRI